MASDLLLGTTVVSCCLFGIMVASDWFYERMVIIGWVFGNNSGQWLGFWEHWWPVVDCQVPYNGDQWSLGTSAYASVTLLIR